MSSQAVPATATQIAELQGPAAWAGRFAHALAESERGMVLNQEALEGERDRAGGEVVAVRLLTDRKS